jgi:hypothetical protein
MSELDAVSRIHRGLTRDLPHGAREDSYPFSIVVALGTIGLEFVREWIR